MIFFYLLVAVMPLVNHPLWSHFVGELTMTKFVGVACLFYALGHCAVQRSVPNFFGSGVARLFLLFYFLAAFSYFWKGARLPWSTNTLTSYTSFLFLFFVTLAVVDSVARLRATLLVAIGSLAFASLYVIREWQQYHNLIAGFRPGYITGDPNYFTLSAVVCLPLAYYMMLQAEEWWGKAYCLGCLLVTLVAVMLAASRGGFLGLVTAVLFIVWRSPRRIRNLVVIAACLIPLLLFAPSSPVHRLFHPDYGDQEGEETRLELWTAGWQMIKQKPLTGVGLDNFKPLVTSYEGPNQSLEKIAHNTYIEVAAEMGIPSLLVFVGILLLVYCTLERVRMHPNRPPFLLASATAMQAALVGSAIAIMFISCEKQKLLWFLVFMAPSLESLAYAAKPVISAESQPVMESRGEDENYDFNREELEFTR